MTPLARRLVATGGVLVLAAVGTAAVLARTGAPSASPRTSGPLVVTTAGTVVEGVTVDGGITVEADDVVVRDSRVVHGGIHSIRIGAGVTGTRIEDTTVVCGSARGNGVVFGGYTALRVTVTGCRNAFLATSGGRTQVVDSTADGEPVSMDTTAGGAPADGDDAQALPASAPPAPLAGLRYGHRVPVRETITADEAKERLAEDPVLERVRVVGRLRLSGAEGRGWTIRDSVLEGGRPYLVEAYTGDEPFEGTPDERPRLEHVTLVGAGVRDPDGPGTSACFYGSDTVLVAVHAYGCVDLLKPYDRVLVEGSWAHGLHKPDGAHADVVQLREGTGTVLRGNRFDAGVGYGPDTGSEGNAVLQTGSLTGPLRRVSFVDNVVDGGLWTLRVGDAAETGPGVDLLLRGNRHGTRFRYGPVTGATGAPASAGGVRYDGSNVWAASGRPVTSTPPP